MLVRIALLVSIPLVLLVGFWAYQFTSSVRAALTLRHAVVMMDDLGAPIANLQQTLSLESAQTVIYLARPRSDALAQLQPLQERTDRAIIAALAATASRPVRQSASADGTQAIAALRSSLAGLSALRAEVLARSITWQQAFARYNNLIAAGYRVIDQAIIGEGNASQVLPGIAVMELAASNDYLQQESAVLDGGFAIGAFPVGFHQAFARLVGAHQSLYVQGYSYLSRADRADLNRDASPRLADTVASLEDLVVVSHTAAKPPPVSQAAWNTTVARLSTGTRQAVRHAEARLEATARSQADTKLRDSYLVGGLGLTAVIFAVILSLWISVRLGRQLRRLRNSAIDMATIRLPGVMRRLRAGEDVDVGAEMPALEVSPDEIGQVNAAFNAAQRSAVEAAVHQARMRRGVNDMFRNLARRSQSLLERQMALLDELERRTSEPDDLDGLFRIDHLSTRMRRHAENLVVLAGDSPRRMFRHPVPFVDVLRAAAAEVEDYKRIRVICAPRAALAGQAVADVVHLLAEFVENAATFSPSNTEVRIMGELVANGFAIDIEDRGLGMSDEQIAYINSSLAHPPLFDLSTPDRLGLFVAARLARQHRIQVTLRRSLYGGMTAVVLIPPDLVVDHNGGNHPPGRAAGLVPTAGGRAIGGRAVPAAVPAAASAASVADPPVDDQPATSGQAVLTMALDADPASAADRAAGQTEHGLPFRVRQAAWAPDLEPAAPATAATAHPETRSPETARDVMSAFQRGWRRGRSEAQPALGPDC